MCLNFIFGRRTVTHGKEADNSYGKTKIVGRDG